mmetsp:Transcript_43347/g.114668  ORF Transcript_43347/g.114668 Transcript_43347/m.114668 type:complete len:495 (+) Transcript_43347:88-1572(+)
MASAIADPLATANADATRTKNCTIGIGARWVGDIYKAWIGNDADSYFPIYSHTPIFVNGTDGNFTQACRQLCLETEACNRWSFWHARRKIGGVCYAFPENATVSTSDWDWEGGWCSPGGVLAGEAARGPSQAPDAGKATLDLLRDQALVWGLGLGFAVVVLVAAIAARLCQQRRRFRKERAMSESAAELARQSTAKSGSIDSAAWDAELGLRAPSGLIDPLAKQPTQWGLTVQQLALFCATHETQLMAYCQDHRVARDWVHVCLDPQCQHDHGAASYRARSASVDDSILEQLQPTMHLVVDLFIKPFTNVDGGMLGYAPLLNKEKPLQPTVFVSHCWNERFPDFVATLTNHLPPSTVVWICSFALPQNMDINSLIGLGELKQSPFAQALLHAQRLFLVVDERLLPLDRVWCLYEMYISVENQIRIDVRAPTMSKNLFRNILRKIEVMDIRKCTAASDSDRERIMSAVRGSEDMLNSEVGRSIEELVRLMESIKD